MALRNGSQQEEDVFEPNTIATAKQYKLLIKNPKAPVKSGWILGNLKQALMSASARRMDASG